MNPITDDPTIIDLVPTGATSPHNSFIYKVFVNENNQFIATVIAQSATGAKNGLSQQFPGATFSFLSKSTFVMQVNG